MRPSVVGRPPRRRIAAGIVAVAIAAAAALPSPILARTAFAVDLYEKGDFVPQARADWCVPAAIQTMANLIEPGGAGDVPSQRRLDRIARSLSSDRLVGPGSEPEGWAGTLNKLGLGPYVVVSVRNRDAAIAMAARSIALTRRPVGLLMWRGAHAWVMSGFQATSNPATSDTFTVTSVRVVDPWYPRTSAIWGAGQRPDTVIRVGRLAADFLPWHRPAVRYAEKDGQYVLVLPVAARPSPDAVRPLRSPMQRPL